MSEPGAARRMAGCTKTNREREIHGEGMRSIEGEEREKKGLMGGKERKRDSRGDGRKMRLLELKQRTEER